MFFQGTVNETPGMNDSDIFVHLGDVNLNTGFTSGVKNKASATDFNIYQGSDGNYYAESGDQRRKSASGVNCDPFVHRLQVLYMGPKAGAEASDTKLRTAALVLNWPEVKQIRFENQEVKI
jgi:hypothetical protein